MEWQMIKIDKGTDTMKFKQINPISMALAPLVGICIILVLAGCGGGGDGPPGNSSSHKGSISFRLDWVHPGSQRSLERSPSGNVCVDYLIDTVSVSVEHASVADISQSWECDIPGRTGTIDNVPEGSLYSVTIDGIVDGNVHWRNQTTGITVTGNQDTNIGLIEMVYIGTDQTPPVVSSHFPGSEDSGISLNVNITATFSEDVVAASVNNSSCALFENGAAEPIPYELNYDVSTKTATIDPDNNLAQNTTYRVIITTEVEDHAGLTMVSNESWTFMTGDVIHPFLVWDEQNWDESLWQER
jgi:hypothetical protein